MAEVDRNTHSIAYLKIDVGPNAPAGKYQLDVLFPATLDENDEEVFFIPCRGKFFIPEAPLVSIMATPIKDTLLVRGDTLYYNTTLTNNSDAEKSPILYVWGMTLLPDSVEFLAVDTVEIDVLVPGERRSSITGLEVPPYAPLGHYTFTAYVADKDTVYDEDPFGFQVNQTAGRPSLPGDNKLALEGGEGHWTPSPWKVVSGWFSEYGESGLESEVASATLPKVFSLSQNYPNPFNPSTTIEFDVPESEKEGVKVRLEIYNMRGRLIKTLVDEQKEAGRYKAHWDGKDDKRRKLGSGIYFYRIVAGDFESTRKLLMIR